MAVLTASEKLGNRVRRLAKRLGLTAVMSGRGFSRSGGLWLVFKGWPHYDLPLSPEGGLTTEEALAWLEKYEQEQAEA